MYEISSSLLAAQKALHRIPYVSVTAENSRCGTAGLKWEKLYSGEEPDGACGTAFTSGGVMIRIRVGPESDSRKLYRQRTANPGSESDFSIWEYTGRYNITAAAVCALGGEIDIIWADTAGNIMCQKSIDGGLSWLTPESIGSCPLGEAVGIAAAFKPDGGAAVFFCEGAALYLIENISGVWQPRISWDKTTGSLNGISAVYSSDWNLLLSGRDAEGDYKVWSLVYGDGGEVPEGEWSDPKMLATAPSGGDYEYKSVSLDKTDVFRCFFVEKYKGSEAYSRPFCSHTLTGIPYREGLWVEPSPFNMECSGGIAAAHSGSFAWFSSSDSVWRAGTGIESIVLSDDTVSLNVQLDKDKGKLALELDNKEGKYDSCVTEENALPNRGCLVKIKPGYVTAEGSETGIEMQFRVDSCEYVRNAGRAAVILRGEDGWSDLQRWTARFQLRWNKDGEESSVKEILAWILARCGIRLLVKSSSDLINSFYPDFTVSAGQSGKRAIEYLLSSVPDVLYIEGFTGYLINPCADDESVYDYGSGHAVQEAAFRSVSPEYNRVTVEGMDSAGDRIIIDEFNWTEIGLVNERLLSRADNNLNSIAAAHQSGEVILRKLEMDIVAGCITAPVNCGQQIYDVIEIAGVFSGEERSMRVAGITIIYDLRKGEYLQKLFLGKV
jgi:hypothetical protein